MFHRVTYTTAVFSLQVPKLIEGREYIIRIMAQNIYGISDPLESAETKARDIYSKSYSKNLERAQAISSTSSDLWTCLPVPHRGA